MWSTDGDGSAEDLAVAATRLLCESEWAGWLTRLQPSGERKLRSVQALGETNVACKVAAARLDQAGANAVSWQLWVRARAALPGAAGDEAFACLDGCDGAVPSVRPE